MCDVGHHETPREIPAYTVNRTEVLVGAFPASPNECAGVDAEVGIRVDQELSFSSSVSNEEAACRCRVNMCLRCCVVNWLSLLAVRAGRSTLLRSGS
jgi:hypothetical protein